MPLGGMLNDFNKLRWHRVMQYSDIKEAPLLMVFEKPKSIKIWYQSHNFATYVGSITNI